MRDLLAFNSNIIYFESVKNHHFEFGIILLVSGLIKFETEKTRSPR